MIYFVNTAFRNDSVDIMTKNSMNCVAEISTEFSVLTSKCTSGCELRSPALVEMKGAGEAKDIDILQL